jgi:hypothetical protein
VGLVKLGFCTPGNPADSHARCPRTAAGVDCGCSCHREEQPAVVTKTGPAPTATAARTAGYVHDLPEAEYHSDRTSLSHSGAKTLLKAPALFRWEQDNTPPFKKAFEFGSAAHARVLGIGAEIRVIPDDLLGANGAVSTKDAKAFIAQARADGTVPLKATEVAVVEAMADKLSEHTLAMDLLSEGHPEVSAYAVHEPTGVVRRCRFDWLADDILVDYKTAESADPKAFGRKAADYGYHCQAPWYLDVARANGHPATAFAFIVQAKTPPYLVTVIELPKRAMDRGRELNDRALEIYRDCTDAGLWPGYAPDTQFATTDLPGWAYSDHEVEMSA